MTFLCKTSETYLFIGKFHLYLMLKISCAFKYASQRPATHRTKSKRLRPAIVHCSTNYGEQGVDEYIHRNGRTARMHAEGSAYSLLGANSVMPAYITPVPTLFQLPLVVPHPPVSEWKTIYISKGKKDKLSKMDVVGFLFKKGQLEPEDLGLVELKDYYTYAAIKAKKLNALLKNVANEKIKNMKVRIEEASAGKPL